MSTPGPIVRMPATSDHSEVPSTPLASAKSTGADAGSVADSSIAASSSLGAAASTAPASPSAAESSVALPASLSVCSVTGVASVDGASTSVVVSSSSTVATGCSGAGGVSACAEPTPTPHTSSVTSPAADTARAARVGLWKALRRSVRCACSRGG